MELEIQHQRSNFSQFSDNLWLMAVSNDTRINFYVDQDDLIEFAMHLIDIADDCLRKSTKDTGAIESELSNAINLLDTLNA
jgi:hypothetical protein